MKEAGTYSGEEHRGHHLDFCGGKEGEIDKKERGEGGMKLFFYMEAVLLLLFIKVCGCYWSPAFLPISIKYLAAKTLTMVIRRDPRLFIDAGLRIRAQVDRIRARG